MSAEHEQYLRALGAEAWNALIDATGDPGQVFAAVVEVYERELRAHHDADQTSDRDYADEIQTISRARTNVQQMVDAATFGTSEHYGLQMILADLNEVLGPDLLREADPTGEALKQLPLAERKRMLDALDSVQKVIDERGSGQPPLIVIVEDEMSPIMERARQLREEGPLEVGSPEHDAFCHEQTAKTAAEDVARGEG